MQNKIKNIVYNYLNENLLPDLIKYPTKITFHLSLFSIKHPKEFLKEWALTHNLNIIFGRGYIWIDKTGASLIK